METKERFIVGYLCYDGSFACIIKNRKSLSFDTYQEALDEMKRLQPMYKHELYIKTVEHVEKY